MQRALLAVLVTFGVLVAAASAGRDPLTGVWVVQDVAGDGSTDRYIFSAANPDGVRMFKLAESYGTFCETGGPGTGAPLTASGMATLDGTTVRTTIESFVCGNGVHGDFDPPLAGTSELTPAGLDIEGYYVATRVGEGG